MSCNSLSFISSATVKTLCKSSNEETLATKMVASPEEAPDCSKLKKGAPSDLVATDVTEALGVLFSMEYVRRMYKVQRGVLSK
jgi:hypothetical protein